MIRLSLSEVSKYSSYDMHANLAPDTIGILYVL